MPGLEVVLELKGDGGGARGGPGRKQRGALMVDALGWGVGEGVLEAGRAGGKGVSPAPGEGGH